MFYLSQDNPIQTETVFLEASKQQQACLVVTLSCRPDTREAGPGGEEEPELLPQSLPAPTDQTLGRQGQVGRRNQSCSPRVSQHQQDR